MRRAVILAALLACRHRPDNDCDVLRLQRFPTGMRAADSVEVTHYSSGGVLCRQRFYRDGHRTAERVGTCDPATAGATGL